MKETLWKTQVNYLYWYYICGG